MGALFGRMGDLGITDDFKQQVAGLLHPGSSAVVILFHDATPQRTIDALAPYGGTVLRTSLSTEAEAQLKEDLTASRPAALSA